MSNYNSGASGKSTGTLVRLCNASQLPISFLTYYPDCHAGTGVNAPSLHELLSIGPVATTASVMAEDREICLQAGMDGYLGKLMKLTEIMDVLEKWGKR